MGLTFGHSTSFVIFQVKITWRLSKHACSLVACCLGWRKPKTSSWLTLKQFMSASFTLFFFFHYFLLINCFWCSKYSRESWLYQITQGLSVMAVNLINSSSLLTDAIHDEKPLPNSFSKTIWWLVLWKRMIYKRVFHTKLKFPVEFIQRPFEITF